MVENNVKENLIDDEEELYVNLNTTRSFRSSRSMTSSMMCAWNMHRC